MAANIFLSWADPVDVSERYQAIMAPSPSGKPMRGSGGLHLHLINPQTGHRVRMVTQDAGTDKEAHRLDLVKGQ